MPSNADIIERVEFAFDEYCRQEMNSQALIECLQTKFPGRKFPTTQKGQAHYWDVVRMIKTFQNLLPPEHFSLLRSSGLIFESCAHTLVNYVNVNQDDCIEIIEGCIRKWPSLKMTKTELNFYIQEKIPDGLTKFKNHEIIRKKAIEFLHKKDCYPISPKRVSNSETAKKIQIDLVGWGMNGDIYGIDAKTSMEDFALFIKEKIVSYMQYCNKLYIITNNEEVVSAAKQENRIGVLFFDETNEELNELSHPIKRDSTPKMRSYIKDVFKNQLCSILMTTDLSNIDKPQEALNTLYNNLNAINEKV